MLKIRNEDLRPQAVMAETDKYPYNIFEIIIRFP